MILIERMARAVAGAEWEAGFGLEKLLYDNAAHAAEATWQNFVSHAHAALTAAREPETGRLDAYGEMMDDGWKIAGFNAVIDAALGEQG